MRLRTPDMFTLGPRRIGLAASLVFTLCWAAAARAVTSDGGRAGAGDPRRGEAVYVGTLPLEARGAPCLACHGVAGHGLARAASFGPDLTAAHESWGGEALEAALAEVPFPSMQPIYASRALTERERRDLVAFLAESGHGAPPRLGLEFVLGVAAAMAAFLVGFRMLGRRRAARRPSSHPFHGASR